MAFICEDMFYSNALSTMTVDKRGGQIDINAFTDTFFEAKIYTKQSSLASIVGGARFHIQTSEWVSRTGILSDAISDAYPPSKSQPNNRSPV
jgi:frataxin-like iron-binding protein CyaY